MPYNNILRRVLAKTLNALLRGFTVLRRIELFFKWYFGNFDFKVRYCGII